MTSIRGLQHPIALWAIIAVAVAFQAYIHIDSGYGIDDSWITFRYSENLVAGHGLVYNIGERVQGSTSPLEIFLVAALLLLGLPAKTAALAISLVATVGLLLCAYRLVMGMAGERPSPLLVLPLAVAPLPAVMSVSGMETMLFIFLQAAVFVAYVEKRPWVLGVLAALLVLTRIDGALVVLAVIITDILLRGRRWARGGTASTFSDGVADPWLLRDTLRSTGVACAMLLPWIGFTAWYFGNPIPNSVLAKRALYSEAGLSRTPLPDVLESIFHLGYLAPWQIGFCITISGLIFLAARSDRFSSIASWFVAYSVFLIAGKTNVHPWYIAPFSAFALIAVVGFANQLLAAMPRWTRDGFAGASLSIFCLIVLVLTCAWGFMLGTRVAAATQQRYEQTHIAIARYLHRVASAGDLIYAPDIGYIGAITGRRILDAVGIVSPEVIPYNRRGDFVGVLKSRLPEWAVIGLFDAWQTPLLTDPWIRKRYAPTFANDPDRPLDWPPLDELQHLNYDWDYLVLRLKRTAE
jgi:hypothetical protein